MSILQKILNSVKPKGAPEKMDDRKVGANALVLKYGSFEVAEKFSGFDENQKELIKFATKSIKKIDPIGGIPLGFPLEFVVTYPDVLLWWNSLSDEDQDNIVKDFDEKDFFDENKKMSSEVLTAMVEAYKNTGATLECCG